MSRDGAPRATVHRCGVVALLGRPNAGKSTLLNVLLGEKLAITSVRAQTTRGRLLGVHTTPEFQILFVDTPGVHRGQARFNLAMTEAALAVAADADVRVVLFDATAEWDAPEERLAQQPPPLLLVRTKCDLGRRTPSHARDRFARVFEISAQTARGLDELVAGIVELLPAGPPLYPPDYLTNAPLRFLAAEQIREVAFDLLRDEIPYSVAVEIEDWKESKQEVRIRAHLLVERDSQKGIVVGGGGRMLRSLGVEARERLRERVGKEVHLHLWVKTDKNWTKRPKRARELGYL